MESEEVEKDGSSSRHETHIGHVEGPVHTGSGDIHIEQGPSSRVEPGSESSAGMGPSGKSTIHVLFLAANPKRTKPLRLDEEIRSIDKALRGAEFRSQFELRPHFAVRVADVQELLLRHRPEIVHFSGHGSPQSEIILEDSYGESKAVPAEALARLFSILKDNIRCVVLNACYSEQQGRAIAEHIDCVIGMTKAVGDPAAIEFAASFYQALGFGRDLQTAFELGCLEIHMEDLKEQDTPKLIAFRTNPKSIFLLERDE